MIQTRITKLFGIEYPIISGGMVWCSGWRLAAAVSNAGGLGLIGSGSMTPDILREHITQCKQTTNKPFGVNLPLFFQYADDFVKLIIEEKVKIVFCSGGSPAKYTKILKDNGIIVVHVVANRKGAIKCIDAGVDAIVAEGFEAGGHNGREETTTMALIPDIRKYVDIPLIAAGGIGSGRGMLAAMALGAEGVQMGTRFVATAEATCSENFKQVIVNAKDGDTDFILKKLSPVRLWKNDLYQKLKALENHCASEEALLELLGKGRTRIGMFEGDLVEGEIEFGQIASIIDHIQPVAEVITEMVREYEEMKKLLP